MTTKNKTLKNRILNKLLRYYKRAVLYYHSFIHKEETKIFCISMQRSGTSSVGVFLEDFGFRCIDAKQDHENNWSQYWYDGNYEAIFSSYVFKGANAYEDTPWFFPDFYKVLFHRFPDAKFILFTRNPDAWFSSMISHSKGDVIGRTKIHCRLYEREAEYLELLNSGKIDEVIENQLYSKKTMKMTEAHAQHYKAIYQCRTLQVQDFFSKVSPDSLHVGSLEDTQKWQKLGKFLNLNIADDYECHQNKSSDLPRNQKT